MKALLWTNPAGQMLLITGVFVAASWWLFFRKSSPDGQ